VVIYVFHMAVAVAVVVVVLLDGDDPIVSFLVFFLSLLSFNQTSTGSLSPVLVEGIKPKS
jgi:hypothetical protein